ncbi:MULTISPECIES: electron transfer flavoprotein subunit beta/FixA family protein [Arthrobacter]|uniref:electron transfer flavoprotein subunit beta/FixA family protein n=1 Tax=unclassified Arthrobacter TaxID=235627 RepID=UPI0024BB7945|nr:electron transfer flavoprotein subunit beta/FixA family protein [Arthrobacter sp. H35-MC1]MDJ0316536.1 electron transfer flavoprotein subunit beta/FixA family protein [Arthrobacter sp. H35-MC1]
MTQRTAVENSALNIVVLVKYVPDAQFDRHLTGEDHSIDRGESILSELDEYALEAALALTDARGGAKGGNTVTALTLGPASAAVAVKKSLQIGATEGLHVSDEALAGSDASATSLALAAAIKSLGPVDLVITGMASTDGETSIIPAQLAARLGLAQITFASALDVTGNTVTARRDGDDFSEEIQAVLPALVSVTDQANEPRYPNFKGIIAAKKKKVTTVSLADLGLAPSAVGHAGSLTQVTSAAERPARTAGTIITDSGDAGIQLVDFLAAAKLI